MSGLEKNSHMMLQNSRMCIFSIIFEAFDASQFSRIILVLGKLTVCGLEEHKEVE